MVPNISNMQVYFLNIVNNITWYHIIDMLTTWNHDMC